MKAFQIIVGNIGTVYDGSNYMQAETAFTRYVKCSKADFGRCSGESVTMMHKGDIRKEYIGTIDSQTDEG